VIFLLDNNENPSFDGDAEMDEAYKLILLLLQKV
jgi:hypothetical protein